MKSVLQFEKIIYTQELLQEHIWMIKSQKKYQYLEA